LLGTSNNTISLVSLIVGEAVHASEGGLLYVDSNNTISLLTTHLNPV